MKRLAKSGLRPFAVALALAAIPLVAAATPLSLSEAELDRIVAGNLPPPAATLGTTGFNVPGRVDNAGKGDGGQLSAGPTAGSNSQTQSSARSGPGMPATIVVGGARADLLLTDQIRLRNSSQGGLRAINLVNGAGADVISVANLHELNIGTFAGRVRLGIVQTNNLTQLENGRAKLGSVTLSGPSRSTSFTRSYRETGSSSSVFHETVAVLSWSQSLTRHTLNTSIESFSPTDTFTINLGFRPPPPLVIPGWGFDGIITILDDTLLETNWGAAATVGETTITLPGISVGTVRFEGDDIFIGQGSITLPALDFPSVTGKVCIAICTPDITFDIPEVGGQTLSLPIPEFKIAGANPFKDIDLQIGAGVTFAGSGEFSFDAVGAKMTAGLALQLPNLQDLGIGFTVPGLFGGDPIFIGIPLPDFQLPLLDVDFTIFDFAAPGVSKSFGFSGTAQDASVCILVLSKGCGFVSFQKEEQQYSDNSRTVYDFSQQSYFEEYSETQESSETAAAEMEDAEADLIVFGASSADISKYSVVELSDGAQADLRALNVTNVTTALVGNALNVSGALQSRGPFDGAAIMQLSQVNRFVQKF